MAGNVATLISLEIVMILKKKEKKSSTGALEGHVETVLGKSWQNVSVWQCGMGRTPAESVMRLSPASTPYNHRHRLLLPIPASPLLASANK